MSPITRAQTPDNRLHVAFSWRYRRTVYFSITIIIIQTLYGVLGGERAMSELPANERWDRVLQTLAAETRRMVLISLLEAPGRRRLPLPAAADSPNLSTDEQRLELRLRHNHLPRLAEAGYVRWESDPFVVRRGPNFDEVEPALQMFLNAVDDFPRTLIDGCHVLEELAA